LFVKIEGVKLKVSSPYLYCRDLDQRIIHQKRELLCNKESVSGKKDQFQNMNDKLTLRSLDKLTMWVKFEKKDVRVVRKNELSEHPRFKQLSNSW